VYLLLSNDDGGQDKDRGMKKDERLLRIGVLGCGPIAQFAHFDACRKARNAELYAICDLAEDLLKRIEAIHEPRAAYRDYDEMLADPLCEAVIIAVADQFHVPLALKAVEAGKHVLIEKPLGVTVEECEALRQRARGTGVVVQIGNNRRFDPGIAFARQFVQEELGELFTLKAWYLDSTDRYTMTDNLQPIPIVSAAAKRPAGDPKGDKRRYFMLGHGSHLVDTARFFGGPIESVRARLVEKAGAYAWSIEVEFERGVPGHLNLIIAIRGDFEEGFQIYGEHGSVTGRVPLTWYHKAAEVECFSVKDGLYRRPLGADAYSYKRQIEGFAGCILDGEPQQGASLNDGVAAMRAMVAIARSVETGETVRLADVSGGV
jgi:predicted dehydrogenase